MSKKKSIRAKTTEIPPNSIPYCKMCDFKDEVEFSMMFKI
jgi:hypothetical protein